MNTFKQVFALFGALGLLSLSVLDAVLLSSSSDSSLQCHSIKRIPLESLSASTPPIIPVSHGLSTTPQSPRDRHDRTTHTSPSTPNTPRRPLLYLLLRPQLVRMPALLLPTVGGPRWQARVAFTADHLVAVVLGRQRFQRGFDDAAAKTEDEVQGGFLGLAVSNC